MQIYLVGGAVRDELLGRPVSERDWLVVGATPEQMLALGYQPVGKDFPVFLHPQTQEEYALARTERKSGHGYTGFACISDPSVTLEQDLLRRDLSINAMAKDQQGVLHDPYGGLQDLQQRRLRHLSPAFAEDPLRVLRVARFAARYQEYGFQVAEETLSLMSQLSQSGELSYLTPERIWKEMSRALLEPHPETFFQVLDACQALPHLLPDLIPWSAQADIVLQRAQQQALPLAGRYALVCELANFPANWANALRPPKDCLQLAQLCQQQGPALLQPQPSSEHLLATLEGCDALRRPERFTLLLATLQCSHDQLAATDWQHALECLQQLDYRDLQQAGLRGAAFGAALRQLRLDALRTLNLPGG